MNKTYPKGFGALGRNEVPLVNPLSAEHCPRGLAYLIGITKYYVAGHVTALWTHSIQCQTSQLFGRKCIEDL